MLSAEEARRASRQHQRSTRRAPRSRAHRPHGLYFARVGATVAMNVEDYYAQGRRLWVRLHEKGGKRHEMPAHHNLETYLSEYIEAAGIGMTKRGRFSEQPSEKRKFLRAAHGSGGRVPDGQAPGEGRRHPDGDRLPHLSCNRNYRVPEEWWQAGSRAADGGARVGSDDGAVRPPGDEIPLDEVERIVI